MTEPVVYARATVDGSGRTADEAVENVVALAARDWAGWEFDGDIDVAMYAYLAGVRDFWQARVHVRKRLGAS